MAWPRRHARRRRLPRQRAGRQSRDGDASRTEASPSRRRLEVRCRRSRSCRGQPARLAMGDDADERIADLQYRDVMEFAVGHGVVDAKPSSWTASAASVETTWIPRPRSSGSSPRRSSTASSSAWRRSPRCRRGCRPGASRGRLVDRYRDWIAEQRAGRSTEGARGEVAETCCSGRARAAAASTQGIALLDRSAGLEAFRIANRAMADGGPPAPRAGARTSTRRVEPPAWRPFQLAFLLMNLRGVAEPTHADRESWTCCSSPPAAARPRPTSGWRPSRSCCAGCATRSLTSAGVSVLMRYTLRLLTLDQLGRAATLICALELDAPGDVERSSARGRSRSACGSGKAATPNRMGKKGDDDRTTARAKTIAFQNNSRKPSPIPIENCPWCGDQVQADVVPADAERRTSPTRPARSAARTRAARSRGDNPLPIVAVDEPLYRRAARAS